MQQNALCHAVSNTTYITQALILTQLTNFICSKTEANSPGAKPWYGGEPGSDW